MNEERDNLIIIIILKFNFAGYRLTNTCMHMEERVCRASSFTVIFNLSFSHIFCMIKVTFWVNQM